MYNNRTVEQFRASCSYQQPRLGFVVVERLPRVWDIAGSITGRVIANTTKMVVMDALFDAQGCWVSITTGWCK